MEYRAAAVAPLIEDDPDPQIISRISGLAVPYEKWATVEKGDRAAGKPAVQEKVIKGAFGQSIKLMKQGRKIVDVLVDHDPKRLICNSCPKTKNGMLRLNETEKGLGYEIDLVNNPSGRWLKQRIGKGEIKHLSMGFRLQGSGSKITPPSTPSEPRITPAPTQTGETQKGSDYVTAYDPEQEIQWRVLKNIDLEELSFLTPGKRPAYAGTTVEQRYTSRHLYQIVSVFDGIIQP